MKLAIMQPYFFPYLGYFDLINCTDQWIFFDTVQYIRHGWINRNRILHPKNGWQYIIAPLRKHKLETSIKNVKLNNDIFWQEKIIGQLTHYNKKAPFFNQVMMLIKNCLAYESDSITCINVNAIEKICDYIDIPFKCKLFSEMNLELGDVEHPGQWALKISAAVGAKEYVNLPGGEALFDLKEFERMGILLTIRRMPLMVYPLRSYEYVPNLSIIDVLMWNDPSNIKKFLDSWHEKNSSFSV
jgi:hypothetical protein